MRSRISGNAAKRGQDEFPIRPARFVEIVQVHLVLNMRLSIAIPAFTQCAVMRGRTKRKIR